MKVLVLGLGISGKSVCRFLAQRGDEVVAVDDKLCPNDTIDVAAFDLFVPSPGIPQTHPLYREAKKAGIPIKGEAQVALEGACQPCIGVTGTNGKTTVVKMIEHCFNKQGVRARAVGNVGEPLTQYVGVADEILVVELSSYQLETLTAQVLDVGLILNIEEDHLDRYETFADYAKAKAQMEHCMKKGGILYVHKSVDPYIFSSSFHVFDGDNAQAAFLACSYFGMSQNDFRQALLSFEKPLHRIEFVTTIAGVAYYNDSKATNVSAVVHALQGFDQPVVLILGGLDKGLNFEPLCQWKRKIKCVVAFGQARIKIANTLKDHLDVHMVQTLQEAVDRAQKEKVPVLFSPGCASFDAFKNYADRGETFKRLVRSLE